MKNGVVKIILSIDNYLKGIIVVKNNNIEKYGFGKISNQELMREYSRAVISLRNNTNINFNGLNEQDVINKLYSMNKIVSTNNNLIIEITKYDNPERFVVNYIQGEKEFLKESFADDNVYNELLNKYLNEAMVMYQFNDIDYLKKINIYKEIKSIEKTLKENKIKNIKINKKRVIAYILTGAVAVVGLGNGILTLKNKKSLNDEKIEFDNLFEPTTTPFDQYDSSYPDETLAPNPIVNDELFDNNMIQFKNILFYKFNEFNDDSIIAYRHNGKCFYLGKDNHIQCINNFNSIRNSDMRKIVEFIENGKTIDEPLFYIYYDKGFLTSNIYEKAFIKYFSNLGNNLIACASSDNRDSNEIIKAANLSTSEFIRLIRDDEPLIFYLNGKKEEIRFSNLSLDARNYILNMAWINNTIMYNRSIIYNNEVLSQYDIYDIILNSLNPINNKTYFIDSSGNFDNELYEFKLKNWISIVEKFKVGLSDTDSFNLLVNHSFIDETVQLPTTSQKDEIIKCYESNSNPYKTRFSQSKNGYGGVKFEGSTLGKSGCGICAFSTGVSCALTNEYDTYISINPKVLLNHLKSLPVKHNYKSSNGLIWESEESNISKDVTAVYSDISIIELKSQNPTFTKEVLETITSASYPVVVSLNGRGHLVCVTSDDGDGKFYVADSDRGYSYPISIKTRIVRSDNRKSGTIDAKKAWIIIPNKDIKIIDNKIYINNLDLSLLPPIGRFETNGKAYKVSVSEKGYMSFDDIVLENNERDYKKM